jgi:excisionase family DNA binding protein
MSETMNEIRSRLQRIEGLLLQKKKVLNFDEAVAFTGYSKSYLYRLTASGNIPHYKPSGKVIYFDRVELEKFLLSGKVKSREELDQEASNYLLKNR